MARIDYGKFDGAMSDYLSSIANQSVPLGLNKHGDMGARGYFKILKEFHKRRTSVRVSDAVAR